MMYFKQFIDEALGNSSYLIGSEATGLAAVIDPQRDVDRYLQVAEGLGCDDLRSGYSSSGFISGAHELLGEAASSGDAEARFEFEHQPLQSGATCRWAM
jgi:hydroxyacylglutathione hydrolase